MAETLSTLSVVAYALAAVFFVLAIVFCIVFKIPRVIDYFTNRSAKKKVKKMTSTGVASKINTLQISSKPYAVQNQTHTGDTTAELNPAAEEQGAASQGNEETAILPEQGASAIPASEELVFEEPKETEMLEQQPTMVLPEPAKRPSNQTKLEMKKLEEIVFIHTQENIP